MANYKYRIITPEGRTRMGTVPAGDKNAAIELLKSGGNTVISVQEASGLDRNIKLPSFSTGRPP